MKPLHYRTDLDALIKSFDDTRKDLLDACKSEGSQWDEMTDSRWGGAFSMLMDCLRDLTTMQNQWKQGQAAYRVTEKMLAEDPNGVAETALLQKTINRLEQEVEDAHKVLGLLGVDVYTCKACKHDCATEGYICAHCGHDDTDVYNND